MGLAETSICLNSFFLSIIGFSILFLFIIIVSKDDNHNLGLINKPFTEEDISIVHYLKSLLAWDYSKYTIAFILLSLMLVHLYICGCPYLHYRINPSMMQIAKILYLVIVPLIFLILFDYIFLMVVIPLLRKKIFCVDFYRSIFDVNTFFGDGNYAITTINKCIMPQKTYIFKMPTLYYGNNHFSIHQKEEYEFITKLSNYLWVIQLPLSSKLKEYVYLLAQVGVFILFFFALYYFYFELGTHNFFGGKNKNFYSLSFLIIWTAYTHYRLKSTNSTVFYQNYFNKYWGNFNNDFANLRALVVFEQYRTDGGILISETEYTLEDIKEDIKKNKNNDTLDRVIEFATAIIAIMLMQYIT